MGWYDSGPIYLISREEVGDLTGAEHIVQVLQKCLVFYVIVCEDECYTVPLMACCPVQVL